MSAGDVDRRPRYGPAGDVFGDRPGEVYCMACGEPVFVDDRRPHAVTCPARDEDGCDWHDCGHVGPVHRCHLCAEWLCDACTPYACEWCAGGEGASGGVVGCKSCGFTGYRLDEETGEPVTR